MKNVPLKALINAFQTVLKVRSCIDPETSDPLHSLEDFAITIPGFQAPYKPIFPADEQSRPHRSFHPLWINERPRGLPRGITERNPPEHAQQAPLSSYKAVVESGASCGVFLIPQKRDNHPLRRSLVRSLEIILIRKFRFSIEVDKNCCEEKEAYSNHPPW